MELKNNLVRDLNEELVGKDWFLGLVLIRKRIEEIFLKPIKGKITFDLLCENIEGSNAYGKSAFAKYSIGQIKGYAKDNDYVEVYHVLSLASLVQHTCGYTCEKIVKGKIKESDIEPLMRELEDITAEAHWKATKNDKKGK